MKYETKFKIGENVYIVPLERIGKIEAIKICNEFNAPNKPVYNNYSINRGWYKEDILQSLTDELMYLYYTDRIMRILINGDYKINSQIREQLAIDLPKRIKSLSVDRE